MRRLTGTEEARLWRVKLPDSAAQICPLYSVRHDEAVAGHLLLLFFLMGELIRFSCALGSQEMNLIREE